MDKGRLIVFEGIDGSGKTTQVERIHGYLRSRNILVSLLREPGGTPIGEAVRKILLSKKEHKGGIGAEAEFLLFASARAELVRLVIEPLLAQGAVILLDRFGWSSIAYQGYGRGADIGFIRSVNHAVSGNATPDRVYLFDIDPATALSRVQGSEDRIEQFGLDFFSRVRRGYVEIAAEEPEIFRIIDGSGSIEDVYSSIIEDLDRLLMN